MLQEHCMAVGKSSNFEELKQALFDFVASTGFRTVSAVVVQPHPAAGFQYLTIDNRPSGYDAIYFHEADARRDPVLKHLRTRGIPLIWDKQTYSHAGCSDLWDKQAAYGYRSGIATALHLPHARHFLIGLDSDNGLPTEAKNVTQMIADLQLFAVYMQEAMTRILDGRDRVVQPILTVREKEALHWTMAGKTAWEVSQILGISQRTATEHTKNAMNKLQCNSKHQAVLKALRLGIIE